MYYHLIDMTSGKLFSEYLKGQNFRRTKFAENLKISCDFVRRKFWPAEIVHQRFHSAETVHRRFYSLGIFNKTCPLCMREM